MATGRMRDNKVKGLIIFGLFVTLSLKSCIVNAQSSRELLDARIYHRVQVWEDSVNNLKSKKYAVYKGTELSMAFPEYFLKSKISQLDGLKIKYIGTNLGGVLANAIGKVKANVGLYYSEPSVPYTMMMMQGSLSGNIYLLRLKEMKHHTLEPYAALGFTHQQTKYYGTYLFTPEAASQYNYSATEAPLIGRTGYSQVNVGAGFEYQLEDSHNLFIHLFAECSYGVPIGWTASNASFSGTHAVNPMTISAGINFGIYK